MRKKVSWMIGGFLIFIILIASIITWSYPFSSFSLSKKYTYKPKVVLYNDQSYEEMLHEFKVLYEKDLREEQEKSPEDRDQIVIQLEEAFPVFEQAWLMQREPIKIDHHQLEEMFVKANEWKDILLKLLTEGDYTTDESIQLVESLNQVLAHKDDIWLLKEGRPLSRTEIQTSLDNLRHQFHRNVEIFFTNFYQQI